MLANHCSRLFLLAMFLILPYVSFAQTAGQVMFVGFNSDGNGFAFVTLVDLANGANIYFNDNEWNGSAIGAGGAFNATTEGEMTWNNNTGVTIRGGTVITVTLAGPTASLGTISGSAITLETTNEVLYMFLGSNETTPTVFLSAIANNGFGANGTLTNTGLTSGTNATSFAGDLDVMTFNGTIQWNSTVAAATTAISTTANWITDSNGAADHTDGVPPDFPTNVPCNFYGTIFSAVTYYSRADGDWDNNNSWTLISDGSGSALLANEWPRRNDNVVILSGHTITISADDDNLSCGASVSPTGLGRSNVGGGAPVFTGAGDLMFYHTGDIIISNGGVLTNVLNAELMLEGYTFVESGGELDVNDDIVNLGYLEVSAGAIFTNTDDLILSGNSVTVINNTAVGADDIYIDGPDATLCGAGAMSLGNGGPDPTVRFFNSTTARPQQICSSFTITCNLNCGAFSNGNPSGNFFTGNTGPGGVGNSAVNELWLKADDLSLANAARVTSWPDASGNGLTAVANSVPALNTANQPGFSTNSVNSTLPSVTFDGGDWLTLGTPASLNLIPQTNNMSFFGVFNVATGSANNGTFLSKAHNTPSDARQYQFQTDGVTGDRFTTWVGNNFNQGALTTSRGAWAIGSNVITTSATGLASWVNEASDLTTAGVGTTTTTADVLVGARRVSAGDLTTAGFVLTGSIAELILYSATTNVAQRIIISNYLAAKYAITLTANDNYTMDNAGNGNYDFEVAGIGQASVTANHKDAKGTGMVRMWNPNALANGDYLLWGHDNGALAGITTGVDGTVIEERLARTWRVSETADVGTVSISFDISSLGTPLGSNLRLLIDRDGDGFADNDVTPVAGSFSNDVIVFSGINFQSGDRFTLGNTDASNPLPVELIKFTAIAENHVVRLNWATASETNNQFFTIERSRNAHQWEVVKEVPGAGTSGGKNYYETTDDGPYSGVSYYRLKQTDFDNHSKYFQVVRVVVDRETPITVYPNPFSRSFNLINDFAHNNIRLLNSNGMEISCSIEDDKGELSIDPGDIPNGLYILQVFDGFVYKAVKIVKK